MLRFLFLGFFFVPPDINQAQHGLVLPEVGRKQTGQMWRDWELPTELAGGVGLNVVVQALSRVPFACLLCREGQQGTGQRWGGVVSKGRLGQSVGSLGVRPFWSLVFEGLDQNVNLL